MQSSEDHIRFGGSNLGVPPEKYALPIVLSFWPHNISLAKFPKILAVFILCGISTFTSRNPLLFPTAVPQPLLPPPWMTSSPDLQSASGDERMCTPQWSRILCTFFYADFLLLSWLSTACSLHILGRNPARNAIHNYSLHSGNPFSSCGGFPWLHRDFWLNVVKLVLFCFALSGLLESDSKNCFQTWLKKKKSWFYISALQAIWVHFGGGGETQSSFSLLPSFSRTFFEETILSPLCILGHL